MKNNIIIIIISLFIISCTPKAYNPLETILASNAPEIKRVMDDPNSYELQILYSQIERDSSGKVSFTDFDYKLDAFNYYYPASSVKWPVAVLAAEFIGAIDSITLETPYTIARDSVTHTVADDIRQLFAVSDNEAYNRLYELLGRDYINENLQQHTTQPLRYAHRLSTNNADEAERDTLYFQDGTNLGGGTDGKIRTVQLEHLFKGNGYISDGVLVEKPMNFSEKNYFSLAAHQDLLKKLLFPDMFSEKWRFNLSQSDSEYLLQAMRTLPKNQGYDPDTYYDSYGKFFMYGDTKTGIPDHVNIYNKVGYAYGTLTDIAYIKDDKNDVEFFLSATILVNENGVFNDDTYEYASVGIPFLAELGRQVYTLELERK